MNFVLICAHYMDILLVAKFVEHYSSCHSDWAAWMGKQSMENPLPFINKEQDLGISVLQCWGSGIMCVGVCDIWVALNKWIMNAWILKYLSLSIWG